MDFFFLEAHALIRDHPCLRGEYFTGWLVLKYPTGSLPLTRGILRAPFPAFADVGITPACAGNTSASHMQGPPAQDHPRLRGEYLSAERKKDIAWDHPRLRGEYDREALDVLELVGSPPLMRGIFCNFVAESLDSGITPAYAGNTFRYFSDLLPL
ncbi:Domain of uncharacterised function (DUF2825) [uncultured Clostridium sp.]|nr:Domain of uncharacterised function (DUF2825) [uncultured Clostridium sp.]